jgi:histone-lysine N-methyltransferase SETMAR
VKKKMTDQRETIKSFVLAGKSATETYSFLVEAYGDIALSRTRVFAWHKEFRDGRTSADRKQGSGRPREVRNLKNIKLVETLVKEDRRQSVAALSLESGLSIGSTHRILKSDLGLSKLTARWIPHLLTDEHKSNHLKFATDFSKREFTEGKSFLEKIVTMDETWVTYYNPELKSQSSQWLPKGSRPPRKAKVTRSEKKLMLIAFFDSRGIIYQHWVEKGKNINSDYYIGVLRKFLKHFRNKRPDLFASGWLLHQDNARPHTSKKTMEFMSQKNIHIF